MRSTTTCVECCKFLIRPALNLEYGAGLYSHLHPASEFQNCCNPIQMQVQRIWRRIYRQATRNPVTETVAKTGRRPSSPDATAPVCPRFASTAHPSWRRRGSAASARVGVASALPAHRVAGSAGLSMSSPQTSGDSSRAKPGSAPTRFVLDLDVDASPPPKWRS